MHALCTNEQAHNGTLYLVHMQPAAASGSFHHMTNMTCMSKQLSLLRLPKIKLPQCHGVLEQIGQ